MNAAMLAAGIAIGAESCGPAGPPCEWCPWVYIPMILGCVAATIYVVWDNIR